MSKKGLALLLVGIMLTVFAGCGSSNNNAQTGSSATSDVSSAEVTASTAETTAVQEAADPYGKYEQPIDLTIGMGFDPSDKSLAEGDTLENNQYTRYIADNLNVNVKLAWQAANGNDYNQKVNLVIASNDLPDGMVVTDTQMRAMLKAGQLGDLTAAYEAYASPIMKSLMDKTNGIAQKAVTFDGKMVAIPGLQVQADGVHIMWIRQDWLDKLGLQAPKTIDELETVAKAFIEKNPDGVPAKDMIGISGPQNGGRLYADFIGPNNNSFGFDPIFSAYHAYPGFWIKDSSGAAVYGSIQPETKEALAKLRDLYAKGLIDKEMSVRKDATEPVVAGRSGIYFGMWWSGYWPLPDAWKNNPNADWQAYALPLDTDGKFNAHMGTPASKFVVIRKGYEHPEAAIKMLNLLIRDEKTFDLSKGGIGFYPLRVPMGAVDESEFTVTALREVLAGTKTPEDFDLPEYKLLKADCENIKKVKLEPYDKVSIQYWDMNADPSAAQRCYSLLVGTAPLLGDYNKVYSITYSQTKGMESKWATLKKLEDETFLKIVMGIEPVESFDEFVKQWKSLGGDQITAEVDEIAKQQ
jgi:putative aldouronate transport system substrate-binding protein